MLPNRLTKNGDTSRLRKFVVLFFLALAVPTGVLIWQAYSQLKWAAFHEYQNDAQELAQRIDARLDAMIKTADQRSFADYAFLVVSGDPRANFVQRSPLSVFPVVADVPGVLGHFQIDTEGNFSTPLLPSADADATTLGIGSDEISARLNVARELQTILADNRLAQSAVSFNVVAEVLDDALPVEREQESDGVAVSSSAGKRVASPSPVSSRQAANEQSYPQEVFDELSKSRRVRETQDYAPASGAALIRKNEAALVNVASDKEDAERNAVPSRRSKRTEQSALAETVAADVQASTQVIANVAGLRDLRINTFESEIDPFEFSLLGSGHFVLFRRVWRDGERYIQGMLLDSAAFTERVIGASFNDTALADMTTLSLLYQDNAIRTFEGRTGSRYSTAGKSLDGTQLYRQRLIAPLNSLELSFDITTLPPGPGARVLLWVTLVLAVVFAVGFNMLYRSGLSQLALAQQQQDFVSAVSHELKSPLTSIRMYGEMLKEGWADEEKRQSYYEFIHDESERLSRLISNVLQLANIAKSEPQVNMQPTNVGELMDITQSRVSSQVERAGFVLRFDTTEDAGNSTVNVDADCFVQMIINLVDNAIKFSKTSDNKTIEISCRRASNDRVLFSVRDYGPGVAKDQMKKIFELFYRTESELTRETVGTGIGLAIVHQLAKTMDGSVDMVNVDPGAEFRFTLSALSAR